MPYKCSCGRVEEKGNTFAAHFTHHKGPEHQRIGWVSPDTGEIYEKKPRRSRRTKKAQTQAPKAQEPKLLPIVEAPQTPTKDAKLLPVVEVKLEEEKSDEVKAADTEQKQRPSAEVRAGQAGQMLGVKQLAGGAVLFSIGQLVIPVSLKELYDTYLYLEDMMIKNDLEEIDFSRGILLCTRHCWQELNHHRAEKQGLAVTTREPVLQEV